MLPQNKNVRQLVWHLQYVDTAIESSEIYCYNTEGDRNSFISQASCRIEITTRTSNLKIQYSYMLIYLQNNPPKRPQSAIGTLF